MLFSRKDLTRLIVPLVIEQVLAITIGTADTMMVASVGEAAVSGVSLVDTINILLINIFSALATGGAVVASQYLGRNDEEKACGAAKQLLYVILGASILIMLIALCFRTAVLHLVFGAVEETVMQSAKTYFWLSAVSYPFLAAYNAGAALYRAMGNSRVSMLSSVLMNCLNIAGNALLIFVFRMGVAGAAISTLFARMVGAVLMVWLIRKEENPIHICSLFHFRLDFAMIKNILRIGVPNGLEGGMFQFGKILTQSLIASFGTAAIAANAVANNLASMQCLPGTAIGLAMITVVGRCVGAGDKEQAKSYTKKLLAMASGMMFFVVILTAGFARPIISLYGLSGETSRIARELIMYHSVMCVIIWPLSFVLPNGLRAASDVRYPMLISIISMWTWRIGLSYVLGSWLNMGVFGVWIAMTADWTFRALLFTIRFLRGKWLTKYKGGTY